MTPHTVLDPDLALVRDSLHKNDDERIFEVQKKRNRKTIAQHLDGQYDFLRLLNALQNDNVSTKAPYEHSVSQRIAEEIGRQPHQGYVFIPVDRTPRRDLTVASVGGGGYLVQSDTGPGGTFVHYLDESLQLARLGISRLSLIRSASIPRLNGTVTSYWLQNEGTQLTESGFDFVVAATSPKFVGAYVEASRLIMKQTSPAAMEFVMRAMARAVAAELMRKILMGSGTNGEIDGILGYTGIHTINAASMNLSTVLNAVEDIETAAAIVNDNAMAFVLAPDVARDARGREKASGSGLLMERNNLAGYPARVSSGLSVNTAICGDWSQLCLMEYSVLEIGMDPYGANSDLFKRGAVGIRALWTVDTVLLNPTSFCELTNLS